MQTIQSPNSQRQWGENTIEQIKNRDHGANTRICFPTPHCTPRRTRSEAHSTSAAAKAEKVSFVGNSKVLGSPKESVLEGPEAM